MHIFVTENGRMAISTMCGLCTWYNVHKGQTIIRGSAQDYSLPLPRRYRRQARKAYLAFAKYRKHTAKKDMLKQKIYEWIFTSICQAENQADSHKESC